MKTTVVAWHQALPTPWRYTVTATFGVALGTLAWGMYQIWAPLPAEVVQLRPHSPTVVFNGQGIATPARVVPLSLDVPGRLMKHYVPDGAKVEAGQILATLDWHDDEQHYRATRAALAQFEQPEVEAQENVAQRQQQLKQHLDHLAKNIAQKSLIAPFSGQIGHWHQPELAYVVPEQPLVVLHDPSQWEVSYTLPQTHAAYVHEGDALQVSHEGQSLNARVRYVAPEVNAQQEVLIKATLEEGSFPWRSGVAVEVSQTIALDEGLWVSKDWLEHDRKGRPHLYHLREGKGRKLPVVADRQVGDQVRIAAGWSEGDWAVHFHPHIRPHLKREGKTVRWSGGQG